MIEKTLFKLLNQNESDSVEYIIAGQKTLYLSELGGDASFDSQTIAYIEIEDALGTEIIFSTSGSSKRDTAREIPGDGVRKIIITITNNLVTPQIIGAFWKGREL